MSPRTVEQATTARALGLLSPDEYLTELCRLEREAAERTERIKAGKAPQPTH